MSTLKPLSQMVPELLQYISFQEQNRVIFNDKMMQIYNGNLLKFVEESCRLEYSPSAYNKIIQRIPPINLLNKVIEKTSKVYEVEPERSCGDNEVDEELLEYYEDTLCLNSKMQTCNELLNLHKSFALEPFAEKGKPKLRILPANTFLVYSDNLVNPNEMTVFIKFMGTIKKSEPSTDRNGKVLKNADLIVRDVKMFYVYSETEFMKLDAEGAVHESRENPLGFIPFVYCNKSQFELLPTPDSDNFSVSVLIPKLLADLNYATLYSSHSIVYGVDVEFPSNVERGPDDIWVLKSSVGVNGEKTTPELNVLKPSVDIAEVLNLITQTVSLWLDTKGIKSSSNGGATVQNAVSGVSKMIDESDVSSIVRKQSALFQDCEGALWDIIKKMNNYWVQNNMLRDVSKDFSLGFEPNVKFGEVKVIPSRSSTLDELKKEFDMKIVTVKQALERLNPTMAKEEIAFLLDELKGVYENNISMEDIDKALSKKEDPSSRMDGDSSIEDASKEE